MKPKLFRVVIAITIFLAVFVFCTVYFRSNIVPTVMDSSVAQMRAVTTNAVNLAATSVLSDGLTYEMLFDIVKDKDGNISIDWDIFGYSPNDKEYPFNAIKVRIDASLLRHLIYIRTLYIHHYWFGVTIKLNKRNKIPNELRR